MKTRIIVDSTSDLLPELKARVSVVPLTVHFGAEEYIEDSKHIWGAGLTQVRYTTIGSVIGTHAGPGAVAVAFFKK